RFAAEHRADARGDSRRHAGDWRGGCEKRGPACGGDHRAARRGSAEETDRISPEANCRSEGPEASMSDRRTILPGATLGVMGSGQLGRMFAIAARRMGYLVHTFSPDSDTPTGQVADREVTAAYDDLDAVGDFARSVDVVTFEFENVP